MSILQLVLKCRQVAKCKLRDWLKHFELPNQFVKLYSIINRTIILFPLFSPHQHLKLYYKLYYFRDLYQSSCLQHLGKLLDYY
jgi:hypothetical protein